MAVLWNVLTLGQYEREKKSEKTYLEGFIYSLNNSKEHQELMQQIVKVIKYSLVKQLKSEQKAIIERIYNLNDSWKVEIYLNGTYSRIRLLCFNNKEKKQLRYLDQEFLRYQNSNWYTLGFFSYMGKIIELDEKFGKYAILFNKLFDWTCLYKSLDHKPKHQYLSDLDQYFKELNLLIRSAK